MKKGNLIFIVGGLGLLYYYFMRKKMDTTQVTLPSTKVPSTTSADTTKSTTTATTTNVATQPTYPAGLQELDLVANGVESAQLYKGQLRPFTAAYAAMYLPGSWPRTKIIPDIVYRSIPRGAVLDV